MNQGDKDDKKHDPYDITPEGEVLAYIGFDQARVIAMQTADETPGDYGRDFMGVRMVFEVVQDSETDEYYEITLAVRPQGNYRGTSGREQFFIEKEGVVAHRQVLEVPIPERRRRPIWIFVSSVIAVVVVASGVVGGLFAGGILPPSTSTPVLTLPLTVNTGPDRPTSVQVLPQQSGQLKSPAGDVTIDLPVSSTDEPITLWYQPVQSQAVPPLPDGFSSLGKAFDLQVVSAQQPGGGPYEFENNITVTIDLSDDDISAARGDASNLVIQHFGSSGEGWVQLPTTVDLRL